MLMNELSELLRGSDLEAIVKVLMPGHRDKGHMVRILREDQDILEGMIRDEKLFRYLLDNPEPIIRVSPHLFFAVLLFRVRDDLAGRSYTVESQNRHRMIVFDGEKVSELLKEKEFIYYLVDMLSSFVRINSFTIPVRIRKGQWRKLRFSDFDIDSLIRYSQLIDEEYRFGPYKRIADICLFMTGIFSSGSENPHLMLFGNRRGAGKAAKWDRETFEERGRYFYKEAARLKAAQILELYGVMASLSENFPLAVKPLSLLSSRYFNLFKDTLFLQ
jgi:hypothetical protein